MESRYREKPPKAGLPTLKTARHCLQNTAAEKCLEVIPTLKRRVMGE
jgi:hypothetical protein